MIADFGLARSIEKATSSRVRLLPLVNFLVLTRSALVGVHQLRRDEMVPTARVVIGRTKIPHSSRHVGSRVRSLLFISPTRSDVLAADA